jgi:hypothetical protein
MLFSDFMRGFSEKVFFENHKIFAFKGKTYPLLLFHHLIKKIEHGHSCKVQRLYLQDVEVSSVKSQLATTFLGEAQVYWCGNLSDLPAKQKDAWLDYLVGYDGPHKIIFFIEDDKDSKNDLIDVPLHVDKRNYQLLQALIKPEIRGIKKDFSDKVFKKIDTLTLDSACLLLEYHVLVGVNVDEFLDDVLKKIVPSDTSLFLLSQYLFSKSAKEFIALWHDIRPSYSDIFWVSFWSEQLWRAYYVAKLYHAKKIVDAKKISFRLPFSFLQKDWRNVQLAELKSAHNYIYSLDHSIKNGASEKGLELFYAKFLSGSFKA